MTEKQVHLALLKEISNVKSVSELKLTEAMNHVRLAQELLDSMEFTSTQIASDIFGNQYQNTEASLEKAFGTLSRLRDMSKAHPLIKI